MKASGSGLSAAAVRKKIKNYIKHIAIIFSRDLPAISCSVLAEAISLVC
jgi:hypothetical protein